VVVWLGPQTQQVWNFVGGAGFVGVECLMAYLWTA
jgi:hypothetical protein